MRTGGTEDWSRRQPDENPPTNHHRDRGSVRPLQLATTGEFRIPISMPPGTRAPAPSVEPPTPRPRPTGPGCRYLLPLPAVSRRIGPAVGLSMRGSSSALRKGRRGRRHPPLPRHPVPSANLPRMRQGWGRFICVPHRKPRPSTSSQPRNPRGLRAPVAHCHPTAKPPGQSSIRKNQNSARIIPA